MPKKIQWCAFDDESEKKSPVIKLPANQDRVRALKAGLNEAEGKLKATAHRAPEQQMCLLSFIFLLKELLKYGEVKTFVIAERMRASYGGGFCPDSFGDSCEAIGKHCLVE